MGFTIWGALIINLVQQLGLPRERCDCGHDLVQLALPALATISTGAFWVIF